MTRSSSAASFTAPAAFATLTSPPSRPNSFLAARFTSSSDIEQAFPHVVPIIRRGAWTYQEHGEMNGIVRRLDAQHSGAFNSICHYRFAHADRAAELRDYAFDRQLHRLRPNSTHGATREEVALEWERMDAEREEILTWGRTTGMLREVVQHYRFERSTGAYSYMAHLAAAKHIEKTHPTVPDPVNRAGVMIVWAEKEHRAWFWNCCRGDHRL